MSTQIHVHYMYVKCTIFYYMHSLILLLLYDYAIMVSFVLNYASLVFDRSLSC